MGALLHDRLPEGERGRLNDVMPDDHTKRFQSTASHREFSALCWILTLLLAASGCSAGHQRLQDIEVGQTRGEVIAAAGEPDQISQFTVPDEPFFGPQEGLAGLLPPCTFVEEWQYVSGEDVTYVWFAGPSAEEQEAWTVIDTAVYPIDAIF